MGQGMMFGQQNGSPTVMGMPLNQLGQGNQAPNQQQMANLMRGSTPPQSMPTPSWAAGRLPMGNEQVPAGMMGNRQTPTGFTVNNAGQQVPISSLMNNPYIQQQIKWATNMTGPLVGQGGMASQAPGNSSQQPNAQPNAMNIASMMRAPQANPFGAPSGRQWATAMSPQTGFTGRSNMLPPAGVPYNPLGWSGGGTGGTPVSNPNAPGGMPNALGVPSMVSRMANRPMVTPQASSFASFPQQQAMAQAAALSTPAPAPAADPAPQGVPQMMQQMMQPSMFGGDDPSMDAWRRSMGMQMPGYMGGGMDGPGNSVGGPASNDDGTGGGTGATYARGGMVRRNTRLNPRYAAQGLSGMGRMGDSTMVHMNPRELNALQRLNGGRPLPRNPQTGLPEAFGLGDILSAVGGIVGSFIAPGIGTGIGAGLGSLGGQAIEGKGIDFGRGLMSGLLGYGLGSAVSGLGAFGEGAGGLLGGAESAISGFAQGAGPLGPSGGALAPEIMSPAAGISPTSGMAVPAGQAVTGGATSAAPGFTETLTKAGQNLTNPDALWQTFGKGFMKTTLPIVGGAYGLMAPQDTGMSPSQQLQQEQKNNSWYRSPKPMNRTQIAGPTVPNPRGYEQLYYTGNTGWNFAAGGPIPPRINRGLPRARGRAIAGRGDGLSDSIPAVVDGREPARLSSGEWVAPAHLVSALGNGSTQSGIRQLEGMADRVMQRKYGTASRRPGPVNAGSYLPA